MIMRTYLLTYVEAVYAQHANTASILYAPRYLYDLLTRARVVKSKIPVLLLCNKVDKPSAHSKDFIRKQLEKEM